MVKRKGKDRADWRKKKESDEEEKRREKDLWKGGKVVGGEKRM